MNLITNERQVKTIPQVADVLNSNCVGLITGSSEGANDGEVGIGVNVGEGVGPGTQKLPLSLTRQTFW